LELQKAQYMSKKEERRGDFSTGALFSDLVQNSALKKSASLKFILNQYIKNKQKLQNAMELYMDLTFFQSCII